MQVQSSQHYLLDSLFPYREDLLQFIWEQGLYNHHALRTIDGAPVEVIKAGRIQRDSGPDLLDARLMIGGQQWAGNVEVHLRSSEWNAHGHQFDPAYDNVVLHVVYEHDMDVRTSSGRQVPTVELFPRIATGSIAAYQALMRGKGFVPCASQIQYVDHTRIGPWLERVLVERLERKAAEVEVLYRGLGNDAAETLYHLLARAFGLKVNAAPFGMLAQALPLKILLKHRDDLTRTEALLFGQAGLLQVDFVEEYPRLLQQEHAILAGMHGLRPAPMAAWKFGRMRPVNFPTVRIAQFAQLVMHCEGAFIDLLEINDTMVLRNRLDVVASEYWATHYTFDRPTKPVTKRLGTAGADHLIINAIVPGLFALGKMLGRERYADRALGLMEQLPAEANLVTRGWAALGLEADTAARGQALIELRNGYCSRRRCLFCGIGNQLLHNTVTSPL
ncbi:MAG: DUF2851 family protein [Flavobacteriales bacterium]|nr:DUF2851 family protein [Flavobacteriales bacterium]